MAISETHGARAGAATLGQTLGFRVATGISLADTNRVRWGGSLQDGFAFGSQFLSIQP